MTGLRHLIIFVLLTESYFSQQRTYIGIESSLTTDFVDIVGNVTHLGQTPLIDYRIGLTARQDINSFLSAEIGFTYKRFHEGFNVKSSLSFKSIKTIDAYCIPTRLITRINLRKEKVFLCPVLGLTSCINPQDRDATYDYNKYVNATDSLAIYSGTYFYNQKVFLLIQTGVSVDFNFKNNSSLTLFSSYYNGLQIISRSYVLYQENDYRPVYLEMYRKGSFWDMLGISYKYPIRNGRQKKDIITGANTG